jgi:hypothetical protein
MNSALYSVQKYTALLCCVLASLLFINSCQSPVEPVNIIPDGGFNATVLVTDQANLPVPVTVQWALLINKQPLTAFTPMTQGNGGRFTAKIPVPLTNDSVQNVKVVFLTSLSPGASTEFTGNFPINGNQRLDTLAACSNLFLAIRLQKILKPSCCNTVIPQQDFQLKVEIPVRNADTVFSPILPLSSVAPCDAPLTVNIPVIQPADNRFSVWAIINGTQIIRSNTTINPAPGTTVQWAIAYSENAGQAVSGISNHTVSYGIATASNPSCIIGNGTITRQTIVPDQPCDCPLTKDTTIVFPAPPASPDEICINSTAKSVLIPIPRIANNADSVCIVNIIPESILNGTGISNLRFAGIAPGVNGSASLLPGESTDKLQFDIQTSTPGAVEPEFRFKIQVIRSGQASRDCGRIIVKYRAIGSDGICAYDLAASTLFKAGNPDSVITIKVCPGFTDSSTTLIIRNNSACPLDLNLNLSGQNASMFDILSLQSDTITLIPLNIVNSYKSIRQLRLVGRERAELRVKFTLNPANGGTTCSPAGGTADFTANLDINGCTPRTIVLKGNRKPDRECLADLPLNLREYGQLNGNQINKSVAKLSTDGSKLEVINVDLKDSADLYVERFPTATTALISGKLQAFVRFNGRSLTNDFIDQTKQIICDPALDLNAQNWNSTFTVSAGDVVIFRYTIAGSPQLYYGLIWVKTIGPNTTIPPSVTEITMQICQPVTR